MKVIQVPEDILRLLVAAANKGVDEAYRDAEAFRRDGESLLQEQAEDDAEAWSEALAVASELLKPKLSTREASMVALLHKYLQEKPDHDRGLCSWLDKTAGDLLNLCPYQQHKAVEKSAEYLSKFGRGVYVDTAFSYTETRAEYARWLIEKIKNGQLRWVSGEWVFVPRVLSG